MFQRLPLNLSLRREEDNVLNTASVSLFKTAGRQCLKYCQFLMLNTTHGQIALVSRAKLERLLIFCYSELFTFLIWESVVNKRRNAAV